jgi:protein-S-isoprenylcysteine O-methyltransferase Ste14
MAPILIFRYVRLARTEEKEMLKIYGTEYFTYKTRVPGFLPSLKLLAGESVRKLTAALGQK